MRISERVGSLSERAIFSRRDFLGGAGLALVTSAGALVTKGGIATDVGGREETGRADGVILAEQYGCAPENSSAENLNALQAAIAATPVLGVLRITGASAINVDTSGGLSNALHIDKPMTVSIECGLKANYGIMGINPPYVFKVTADDVAFIGDGWLEGDGRVDDANVGDITVFPGLVYVTGDRFVFDGPAILTPPKVGIALAGAENARIRGVFKGGPVYYTPRNTAYFAIVATGGGGHDISARFERDARGGRFVNAIFTGGALGNSNECYIHHCYADAHEKLFYGYGHRHRVYNNDIERGEQTDVIRVIGSYNWIAGNSIRNCKGGISVYDGHHNEVRNNDLAGIDQIAINVGRLDPDYSRGHSFTQVSDNHCLANPRAQLLADGVRLNLEGASSSDVGVTGNTVRGFALANGQALIRVDSLSTITRARIARNVLVGSDQNALIIRGVRDSVIENNKFADIANNWAVTSRGGGNLWRNNEAIGFVGAPGIAGLGATDEELEVL